MASEGEQELAVLQGLGRHISEVIELCAPTSETAICGPATRPQSPRGVAEVADGSGVTASRVKRHRQPDMQGGEQLPHHHHDAAAAIDRQSRTSATARATVLTTGELLTHIMGYLGGGSGGVWARRGELGRMALVCRAWRDAAHSEALWGPLVREMIPRLAAEGHSVMQDELRTKVAGSCRLYLVRCGQLLMERGLLSVDNWAADFILQCQVWDEKGSCMFSVEETMEVARVGDELQMCAFGRGPVFSVTNGWTGHHDEYPPQALCRVLLYA